MKYIVHFSHDDQLDAGIVRRYAERRGYSYRWVSLNSDLFETASIIKHSSMVVIWNGLQYGAPLVRRLCERRGIPVCYFEWGLLPQSAKFSIDLRGFCGDSMLAGDLSWVTHADMDKLYETRSQLQNRHPTQHGSHILIPLQIENDTQVLYFSPYRNMQDFVADVVVMYPNAKVVVRPHPKSTSQSVFDGVQTEKRGSFLEAAARAGLVIGLTSTCLFEAAILGVPVIALGDHPLRLQPRYLHDRVLAGALALCLDRATGDLGSVLDRFGLGPL
jgi:capsule polysaccharide export protein KpsC/LpsZ